MLSKLKVCLVFGWWPVLFSPLFFYLFPFFDMQSRNIINLDAYKGGAHPKYARSTRHAKKTKKKKNKDT